MNQEQFNYSREYTDQAIVKRTVATGAFIGFAFYLFWIVLTKFHFTPYPIHYYVQRSMDLIFDIPTWFEFILLGIVMILLSIILALMYYVIARNWMSIWVGVIYGGIIATLHLFIIHPLFFDEFLFDYSYASTVTIITMHVLYGVSVGYSITFDYTESLARRKKMKENENMG